MSVERRAQELADVLGRPLIVFDARLNVVAFSVHDDEVDAARLRIILTHKGSRRAAEMILEAGVAKTSQPVVLPASDGIPPKVVAALRVDDHLAGFVSYASDEQDPLSRETGEAAICREQLAKELAARTAEMGASTATNREHDLLGNLLLGNEVQRRFAAQELVHGGHLSAGNRYSVIVYKSVDPKIQHRPEATARMLESALAVIPRFSSLKACGAVLGDEAVVLIPYMADRERMAGRIAPPAFASFCAGAGEEMTCVEDAHTSYAQARIAWRAASLDPERYGRAALWPDMGIDRLLLRLPLQSIQAADLPDSVSMILDAKGGTDLAQTLEVYLDQGADAKRTAADLHVHRSTLYYRLDRIKALTEADLTDGRVRREMQAGLRVARLAGLR